MTRLIDADALNIHDVSPAYGMYVMGVTEEDIDDAPTVEAIPVEWIKSEAEKCKESAPLTSYAITEILRIWDENQ